MFRKLSLCFQLLIMNSLNSISWAQPTSDPFPTQILTNEAYFSSNSDFVGFQYPEYAMEKMNFDLATDHLNIYYETNYSCFGGYTKKLRVVNSYKSIIQH